MRQVGLMFALFLVGWIGCEKMPNPRPEMPEKTLENEAAVLESKVPSGLLALATIEWQSPAKFTEELTGDGIKDAIFLGQVEGGDVAIGIVSGAESDENVWVVQLKVGENTQDSLCGPVQYVFSEAAGGPLENEAYAWAKTHPSAHGFAVDDGGCDAFHFYWSPGESAFVWWRN